MAPWKVLSALVLLSPIFSHAICTYTWNGGSGNWNTAGNWTGSAGCSTWPGDAPVTNTDIASFTTGTGTVNLTASASINSLIFNDNSGVSPAITYTITDTSPSKLIFVGTNPTLTDTHGTHVINAVTHLNLTTGNALTITVATAGDTLTFASPLSDFSGTSSLTLASGNGTLANTSTINSETISLIGGTYQNAGSTTAAGTLTIAGTTVTSNNSSTPPFICNTTTSGPLLAGATVNISSGNVTLDSAACGTLATAGVIGTSIQSSTNALAISGGTVNVTNEAAITATGAGATGGLLSGIGVTVSAGTVNLTNTGTISGTNDAGVFLYSNTLASGNPMTFSGGTVTATNNGSVTSGVGALVQSGSQGLFNNPVNVSGGAFTLTNTFNLASVTAGTGASLVGGALGVSAGSITLSNTGDLASFPGQGTNGTISGNITISGGGATFLNGTAGSPNTTGSLSGAGTLGGVEVTATGNFIQTGGAFTNENAGTIAVGTGTSTNIAGTTSLSTAGTFTNLNSGNVTALSAIGSYFVSGGTLSLAAGITVNLSNSGTITAAYPGSVGSYMRTPSLTDSGSTLNITNSGSVSGYAGTVGYPGTIGTLLYATGTGPVAEAMMLTGGTWTATNTGTIGPAGTGLQIECDTGFSLGGNATITVTNGITANVSAFNGIGCQFMVLNDLTFPSGSTSVLSLVNNQALTSGGVGTQSIIQLGSSMAGGTLNITNTNTVGAPTAFSGSEYLILSGAFIQTGGTVNMNNTGTISSGISGASGVGLKVGGSPGMTLTGGSFNMTNSGTLNSSTVEVIGAITTNTGALTIGGTAVVTVTNNGPVSSPTVGAIGCQLSGSGITMNGGTLFLINNGTISGPSSSVGAYLNNSSTGPMVFSGGTFTGTNNSASVGASSGVKIISGPPGVSLAPIVVDGGTVTLTNTGNLSNTSSSAGTYVQGSSLAVSSGSLTLSNSGNLTAFPSPATNAIFSTIAINGGSTTLLNSGSISGAGSQSGTRLFTNGVFSQTGGTLSATNTGAVSVGTGVLIQGGSTLDLTGGSLNMLNAVSAAVSGTGLGSQLLVGTTLNISNASSNLTLQNNQAMASGTGVQATASMGTTMSGGTFNVINTANLSGSATGAAMLADVSFNQTGGTFTVSNSGVNSGSGNASYIQSPSISISGSGTFNNPNALVAATTVTLTSGGTLQSGTATVPGVFEDAAFGSTTSITNNGGNFVSGTLAPASPGQTIMNGVFTQNAGTYFIVVGNLNLPGNQGVSFLTVDGTAPTDGVVNLDGGTLNVIPATSFNRATDIPSDLNMVQFIQASALINGGFSPAKINNYVPGLSGLTYETLSGNQGWLFFSFLPPPPVVSIIPVNTPIPYQSITITTINMINTFLGRELLRMQDQIITADQANDVDNEAYEYEGYYRNSQKRSRRSKKSSTTASAGNLLMSESPEIFANVRANTISDQMGAIAGPKIGFSQYQSKTKQEQLASEISSGDLNPWNVYFGPLGDVGSIKDKNSQLGAHYRSAGMLAGFDYRFSQVGLGLLVDYENVKAKLHKHGGDFWINQFHATAYSTYVPSSFPQFALNGMVGAGGAWYNIHRNILGLPKTTKANSRGAEVDALIGTQYLFSHRQFDSIPCGLEIVPMVNLQYIYQGVGSYKEHGAGAYDLKFHKQGFQSLRSTLGTWLQYIWSWKNFSFTPLVNIGWQREFLDHKHKVLATPITGGPEGSITIFGGGRNTLLAGLDLLFELYNTYGIEASYDFEYNSLYRNNGFYVGFNVRF